MELKFRKATANDIDRLTQVRIEVLRSANQLDMDADMSLVETETYAYYQRCFTEDAHVAFWVFDQEEFAGCGGISFYQVMPTYHNPTGKKAYIMNMYTRTQYRRRGIASQTLDLLISEAKARGISQILLEATDMGRALYKSYGFSDMEYEMELITN